MEAFRLLELLILVAVLVGFVGLLLRRNLFLKVLAMDVIGSAVVALFVLVAARSGLQSPILPAPLSHCLVELNFQVSARGVEPEAPPKRIISSIEES